MGGEEFMNSSMNSSKVASAKKSLEEFTI